MKIPSLLCVPLACAITGLPTAAQTPESVPPVGVVEPTFLEALKGGEVLAIEFFECFGFFVSKAYRHREERKYGSGEMAGDNTGV